MKKTIVVALGDLGSWNYLEPVHPELERCYNVALVVDPKGGAVQEALREAGIDFAVSDGMNLDLSGVAAVFCGTAAKAADLFRNVSIATRSAGIKLVWFGDFYGSGCEPKMRDLSPCAMLAFDDMTARIFLQLRPDFPKLCLHILGNPAFDKLADFDLVRERAESRTLLAPKRGRHLVYYSASSLGQFDLEGESIRPLVKWAKSRPVDLAVGFHPADINGKPKEVGELIAWISKQLEGRFLPVPVGLRGLSLFAAMDLVVTDYSTTGVEACLAGIPTAFMLGKTAVAYQENRGLTFPFFSILEGGNINQTPAVLVANQSEYALDVALERTPHEVGRLLQPERFQRLRDGHAGLRVLDHVRSIVG